MFVVLQTHKAETGGESRNPADERDASQAEEGAGSGGVAVRQRGRGARHAATAGQAMTTLIYYMLYNKFCL